MKIVYKNGIKLLVYSNLESSKIKKENKDEAKLILNNSNSESEIEKDKGIFYIYENLYLNKNFEKNLSRIINNTYEHNDETLFRFFLVKKQKSSGFKIVQFVSHLASYPSFTLKEFNTKVYKNTGLIFSQDLFLNFALADDLKSAQLSKHILDNAIKNISEINESFHLEHSNTYPLIKDKFNLDDELLLMVHYEYEPEIFKLNQLTIVDTSFN